ncbi:zinc knuckle CX2CX4HX4C containing protein [Tanacetum coccineum]|uniref:Zinc knuckle CX2CX4HX4C containing protein n=1 Tax=Tanacetum coccineum TaxID=301880 RepID=A0ABQ5API1_9ASTR
MAGENIDNLIMEKYLTLTRGNQAPGVVRPEIEDNVNFEIKRVTHDAVMLRVFPITLTRAAKRWVDRLTPGIINTWDLLKKAFIQRYCPPSKTAKQPEHIHNFKQEGKETLYQAWESNNSKGMAVISSKLDNLDRDMKKLKENVHAIQVGCQLCGGPHLDKECLNEEVKSMEEVKYEEFGRLFPNNNRVNEKFGGEVEGRTNKAKFEECKAIYMEDGTPLYTPFHYSPEDIENFSASSGFSDIETQEDEIMKGSKGNQLPPKEEDSGSFILPCSIGRLDFNNPLADLGANINIMPFSMYKHLGMGKHEPINMVINMVDNTKSIPKGIVKNLLIKIDKFIFPVDFVVLDIIKDFRMPIILWRCLLAMTHAKVDIFRKTISLEVGNEKVVFNLRGRFFTTIFKSVRAIKSEILIGDDDSEPCDFNQLLGIDPDIFAYDINMQGSYKEAYTNKEIFKEYETVE